MAAKCTRKRAAAKPDRPKGFPLFPHNNGQWAKRIKGRLYCFGTWADPDAARARYLDEKEYLEAGRKPPTRRDGLRMLEAVNRFLTTKHSEVQSGELTQRSWNDYNRTAARLLAAFGRERLVADLRAEDFEELKAAMGQGWSLTTLGNEVQRIRCLFGYLWQSRLIPAPPEFGPTFKRPSKKARRRQLNARAPLLFSAAEIRQMLEAAPPKLRAMVLLGVNCALGNTDLGQMPIRALDLDGGFHNFGRPKTGVARRCPLWGETVEALRGVIATRSRPKEPENSELVFLTRHGRPYVRLQARKSAGDEQGPEPPTVWNDAIGRETDKLLRSLGMKRQGVSFYSLRRTFRTVAAGVGDERAVDHIMGHADADADMGAVYIQGGPDDLRLKRVTDFVKAWLYPETEGGTE